MRLLLNSAPHEYTFLFRDLAFGVELSLRVSKFCAVGFAKSTPIVSNLISVPADLISAPTSVTESPPDVAACYRNIILTNCLPYIAVYNASINSSRHGSYI